MSALIPNAELVAQASQLSQLVSVIVNATQIVEAHAAKGDLSLEGTHSQTDALSTPEVREAIQIIEGACAQLCIMVARPSHTILNVSYPVVS